MGLFVLSVGAVGRLLVSERSLCVESVDGVPVVVLSVVEVVIDALVVRSLLFV